jgi:serine/threonine protein kinase
MALLHEGQVIRSTYEVERFIGEGAFAEVYRVKHRFLGRQAMKVFKIPGITSDETEAMLGEAIMLSRIGHPNIVRVFDANVTETSKGICGFFTMEYVAGGNLDQFWRSHGSRFVPTETAVNILQQVCRGLAIAHDENPPIVHRDIKPANILVGYDGGGLRARVSDFGLARRVNPLTLLATTRGTLLFKAPEAVKDRYADSCTADVWALGCTLYLLLTDRLPYPDEERHFDVRPLPPSRVNVQVDAALDRVALKALSIEPGVRYRNAGELLTDLERWSARATAKPPMAAGASDMSKTALGTYSPDNESHAHRLAAQAVSIARQRGRLTEAADLMEEAFNKLPALRVEYAGRVKLWRRGIVM